MSEFQDKLDALQAKIDNLDKLVDDLEEEVKFQAKESENWRMMYYGLLADHHELKADLEGE